MWKIQIHRLVSMEERASRRTANAMLIISTVLIPAAIGFEYLALIAGTAAGHGTAKTAAPFVYMGVIAAVCSFIAALIPSAMLVRELFVHRKFVWQIIPSVLIAAAWVTVGLFAYFIETS